ncbi:OmpP1/FadL family transporter [Jeongeupia chitinilytica]|uniref:Outer membrane protein n=1 Tax=Jeongeupia chitinilytica TaxID=1041641 RepID=A0ABQ3H1S7_9NEIS|nr:OmpP1/FadL family transporter [Jeongeupia chitinilytica]GHD63579.1 putative outer membrane protein [Jeongeupia chitinilytica]
MKQIAFALRMIGAGSLVVAAAGANASGYNFGVQSVSAQGVANSAGAAAQDATTIFYNPAGMTYLPGTNISAGLVVVDAHVKAENVTATTAAGRPVSGGDAGDPTSPVAVPQLYASYQLNEKVWLGLGIFVPFGDAIEYNSDWVGRYNGNNLDLKTIAINPSFAYKINDQFSVGAGVTAQYMDAKFKKRADFGTQAGATVVGGKPLAASNPKLLAGTGQYDGELDYEGTDWAFGFNLGAMWQIDPTLRVGTAYRSSIKHSLEGDANWSRPGTLGLGALDATVIGNLALKGYRNGNGTVEVDTPDSYSLNFYKVINDQFAIMGDWTYTWHSKFEELRLKFETGLPDAVIEQDWKNTSRYSLGATYKVNDPLTLRFGLAYDQSPVPSDSERIAALPDNDRIWYSIGANYAFNKDLSLDVAYTYVDIQDASMNNTECSPANGCTGSGTTTKANFKSYANILGAQLNYRF